VGAGKILAREEAFAERAQPCGFIVVEAAHEKPRRRG